MVRAILVVVPVAYAIEVLHPVHHPVVDSHVEPVSECWLKVGRPGGVALNQDPGAGLGKLQPYDRVHKDGMFKLDCIKDSMFRYGDKFGGNKHEYRLGPTANVTIVHYDAHVAKEDRHPMTPKICFQFCRTIPEMGYFGITNGRDCYCEPYYKALAGNDQTCDSVCEGDKTQICGSKDKSQIWEMHACNDGAQVLAAATIEAYLVQVMLDDLIPRAMSAAQGKQALAVEFQNKLGQAGDPSASALMQSAKVSAGELLHLAEQADKIRNKLRTTILGARAMTGLNLQTFHDVEGDVEELPLYKAVLEWINRNLATQFMRNDVAVRGDKFLEDLEEQTPVANKTMNDLQELFLLSEPELNPSFRVVSGSCTASEDGCIQSRNTWSGHYYNADYCNIEIQYGEIELKVEKFDTQPYFDRLFFNGRTFSGDMANNGILDQKTASGWMYWRTNWYSTRTGWKICGVQKNAEERGRQYYPAMYFVDKDFADAPMTCSGTIIEQPIYFKNYHGCAAACDARLGSQCVGFSYYPTGTNRPNLCFLFSSFESGQYYTGCNSMLQRNNATRLAIDQPITDEPSHPICVAKLSKFVDTTLKPDPEGKCKQCFKELTKANRCWETGGLAQTPQGPPQKLPPRK